MWFLFAILTTLAWGGADVFYKLGSDPNDKHSHLKIAVSVGFVMGVHALIYYFVKDVEVSMLDIVKYLPVSACYILSMVIGYVGLRYLALSISSPVQNTSGVLVTIMMVIFFGTTVGGLEIAGIVIITVGLVVLALLENFYGEKVELTPKDRKYKFSFLAIVFPLIYCVIDALGTFGDGIYLDEMELISEDAALIAYESTFFVVGLVCLAFMLIKRGQTQRKLRLSADFNSDVQLSPEEARDMLNARRPLISKKSDAAKLIAAILETIGQFFYVFAMSGSAAVAAPLIASYSVFAVIFSRIFLKEKLKGPQYAVIVFVLLGILLLGIAEGIAE